MKNILIILLILSFNGVVKSQVSIGKDTPTNSSVSLEFGNNQNRGFILPYVENKSSITVSGTMIYDTTDHKVKYLKDGAWIDLSVDGTGVADISIQQSKTDFVDSKLSIGNKEDSTSGILVLTDEDRAMILPKVSEPHKTIIAPSAGLIVYDTTNKQLAVYNGTVWTFWKPE